MENRLAGIPELEMLACLALSSVGDPAISPILFHSVARVET
jgi:hypothetical protein